MKLSDFKKDNTKKLTINRDGSHTFEEVKGVIEDLEGDILFYELSLDKLNLLNESINNNVEEDDIAFFMYETIKAITNVEVDIDYKGFLELMVNPSDKFIIFMNKLKDYSEDIIEEIVKTTSEVLEIAYKEELSELDIYKGKIYNMSFDELIEELILVKDDEIKTDVVKEKMLSFKVK